MILDVLKEANSVILDSVEATNNKQAAENFNKQLATLSKYTLQLEYLLNMIIALAERNFISEVLTENIRDSLQTAVDSCGEKTSNHTLDASAVMALKSAIELCQNAIENTWKEAADKSSTVIVETLISLKGLLNDKKEAENIIQYLNKAKLSMPVSIKDLDIFKLKVQKGKEIIEDLHFTSYPEVKVFIDKVRVQKATVGDLTPHIMEWLKENRLSDKIALRFQTF